MDPTSGLVAMKAADRYVRLLTIGFKNRPTGSESMRCARRKGFELVSDSRQILSA